ncbi:thermonuclease family protein [Saccharomonospora xinjiangensis]|uniref:thermonuclease family protein n=1 Tax=Saccharomonospora xinjiangensis TaxID=75294 RepID=UPI0039E90FF6
MAVFIGLFVIISLAVGVVALFKRSPIRRWYARRQRPGRAAALSLLAWAAAFAALIALVPNQSEDATDNHMPGAATSEQQARKTGRDEDSPTASPPSVPSGVPAEAQQAEVRQIVDGDTLQLAARSTGQALDTTAQVDVRLLEIDTPETGNPSEAAQCYSGEATARLEQLAPPGTTVWIQRDRELQDRYGRYLLYLWNKDGVFVNLDLVAGGFADAVLYPPNDLYWGRISTARDEARAVNAGLWGTCPFFGAPSHTPEPQPPPEPAPPPVPQPAPAPVPEDDHLVPPPPPDLDCGDIPQKNFPVQPGDPHRLDADGDGIGCEG